MLDFLTPPEVRALTGRRAHRLQVDWLRQRSIPHETDADGRPKVLRGEIQARLSGGMPARHTDGPRLEVVR